MTRVLAGLAVAAALSALAYSAARRADACALPMLPAPAGRAFDAVQPDVVDAGAAPDASVPAVPPTPRGGASRADAVPLDLALLAFPGYDPPELRGPAAEPLGPAAFPAAAAALDGRFVEVEGYMLASDVAGGRVARFVLARFPPGCCFGAAPILDEWLEAWPGEAGVEPRSPYTPLVVIGRLEVGEALDEAGLATSLYRLREASVAEVR